ncbi:hypothetical protein EU244_033795 [Rhodococcus qingshengii]|uniref:hypothetical protein n=1 Tax=Rhodococcus qingshengii TaxID=334542 RepID=UPI0010A5D8F8|nr:hypothetical protein [Rhodococcus qingshengii]THJ69497.1 hypothetical protein EU244_21295 [Rhodococcus qingshengii]
MTTLDESLPWPPPDERAEQIRELRRENGKLLAIVAGVGSDAGPRKGQDRRRHAVEILQAIGKAGDDRHVAHYVRLGHQYGLTFVTIATLLGKSVDDVHEFLKAGDGPSGQD